MSKLTVWKYNWPSIQGEAEFDMPSGAEILHVAAQHDTPCIWARVNPDATKQKRKFTIVGTGHLCPDAPHVGSFLMSGGAFVFHIFETTGV